jgi:uncharacterized protein YjcR
MQDETKPKPKPIKTNKDPELVRRARELWFLNYTAKQICEELKTLSTGTVYYWADKFDWDQDKPKIGIPEQNTRRYIELLNQKKKTATELQEMEFLGGQILKYEDQAHKHRLETEKAKEKSKGCVTGYLKSEGVETDRTELRKKDRKRKKNEVGHLSEEDFQNFFDGVTEDGKPNMYKHQRILHDAMLDPETYRTIFCLKPRQVGGTYGIAATQFYRAAIRGESTSFISATKAQAEVFKSYIAAIAMKHFNVEISGNPARITRDGVPFAELHYLSPNSNAQSRAGHVVFDEVFWTARFKKMEELAKPMSTQKQYSRIYISTPSTISHDAYAYWDGSWYNEPRHAKDRVKVDVSDWDKLKGGIMCEDGVWRYAYTIHDAVDWGFDLTDVEQIRQETDPHMFPCLYECRFIDDRESVFKLKDILACGVDTSTWKEFDKNAARPYGNLPVTSGYDPAGNGDNASFPILSKPRDKSEKFRLLVKRQWQGVSPVVQAEDIKHELARFNMENMMIDATGAGALVAPYIEVIYPTLEKMDYRPEQKCLMVMKAKSVIQQKRFEYDENDKNLALSFMTVRQGVTEKTQQITYYSTRSKAVGHGDDAWGTMMAMMCEPVNVTDVKTSTLRVIN